MATKRLRQNIALFRVLSSATPKLRKAILKNLSNESLRCLCDCSHNLLNGNIHLTPRQKRNLLAHRKTVRMLASRGASLPTKKKAVQQRGGVAVTAILVPLLGVAASLLADKYLR